MLLSHLNSKPFYEVCNGSFGRKVIFSSANTITEENVVAELAKALAVHWNNRTEIEYLDNYYRGMQPILARIKRVRPEINNRVVENHAFEIVEFKTAQNFGEPVQYVRRSKDEALSDAIAALNDYMYAEDKGNCDIQIGRWRSICGTAYRFVYVVATPEFEDSAPFGIESLDPRFNFVVYSTGDGGKALFSVSQRKNEDGENYYVIYTKQARFEVKNSKVIASEVNGIQAIPIIEYPNNERRLSDIEIVITLLDAMNKMQSDRMNGVEQFVQAFMKFVNCEVDKEKLSELQNLGAVAIKNTASGQNADVDLMTAELNQEQGQIAKDDLYDNMISIVGMPSREQNTGGDTGQAVYLRNGWDFAEQRAELSEPAFQKAERQFLRIVLFILTTNRAISGLKLKDIEIKVTRSKTDNMYIKSTVLKLLLEAGIDEQTAIKTCDLWSDPEETYLKSQKRLKDTWSAKSAKQQPANNPANNSLNRAAGQ